MGEFFMKNVFKTFGVIALVAVIGFSACDTGGGGDNTPPLSAFAGTWNASNGRSIHINGNSFEYRLIKKVYYGNFSVSGSTITFDVNKTETWSGIGKKSGKFTLSTEDGTLTLSDHTWDINVDGVYTKFEYSDSEEPVETMKFNENSGDWKEPGHEDYSRWYYNYHDENNLFDLSTMYANNKAYIFTCSFSSDIDIDEFSLQFAEEGYDDSGDWHYKTISDWTWLTWGIKKDTRYNTTVFLIPNANATGTKPEKINLQFLNKNRNVATGATVSVYQFSLEEVEIVDIDINVTANGSAAETTTELTLTLAQTIDGLSADDITFSGIKGVTKDQISGSGTTYTLPISGFTKTGPLNVGVEKPDYVFKNWIKQVTIYYYKENTGENGGTFDSLEKFKDWLNKQKANSKNNPYKAKLNLPNLSGLLDFLKGALDKFLNLDLSGSKLSGGIGAGAFKGLSNLTGITLPSGINGIGAGAFSGCDNLSSVTFKGKIPAGSFSSGAFEGLGDLRDKYLAGGAGTYTRSSDGTWSKEGSSGGTFDSLDGLKDWLNKQKNNSKGNPFNLKLKLPNLSGLLDFLKGLSGKFFNLDLSGMNLSGGIGADAFKGLGNLTGLTLPGGITGGIGANAFNGCGSLNSITIPKGINGIGANAFTGCGSLNSVTFDGTIPSGSIDNSAFSGLGDLRDKYLAGGPGTYTREEGGTTWTKQDDTGGGTGPSDIAVTFNSISQNGSSSSTTTQLTLSFSQAITGLSASDITITGVTVNKGTLSGSGSTYTLPISGFTEGGSLNVSVSKTGYNISDSSKTVTIYYIVSLLSVTANGYSSQTTQLTLNFNQAISGLSAGDITVSGVSGVNKGATLGGSGTAYTLPISGFTTGGTLDVRVTKSGINDPAKKVTIYYSTVSGTNAVGSTLADKLTWLQSNAASDNIYIVEVTANESLGPTTLSYAGQTNVKVLLQGDATKRTVSLSSNGSLFTVGSGVTLILDNNITLQGRSGNTASLVKVNSGGTLAVCEGSVITGNTFSTTSTTSNAQGGGVNVDGGTLIMEGGQIISNTASSPTSKGGGVYVSNGTLTMNNGKISSNTSSTTSTSTSSSTSYGGGVFMESGTFTVNGGEISNNTSTDTGSGGRTVNGGGVSGNGTTFTMSGGKISGNTASSVGNGSSIAGGGIDWKGDFTMSGGEISGNTVSGPASNSAGSFHGGGVYVYLDSSAKTFIKTGGTIYGYTSGDSNSNVVKNSSGQLISSSGRAVFIITSSAQRRRETTAGSTVNLNSGTAGSAGGWEN